MFDALLENRFIQYHWQSVLEIETVCHNCKLLRYYRNSG